MTYSEHLHVFRHKFDKKDLPSSTTIQSMVEEGHFIVKTFISEKLATAENWGINHDRTTRRKKKIIDTSITIASNDIYSLGFNTVAHETAEAITNATKTHVTELADIYSNSFVNDFINQSIL
jgi:hypothetical protein